MLSDTDVLEQNQKITPPDGQKLPDYFVAIGASAGGLEALQQFFANMPISSDAAFIIVQHLSPDFKSVMAELLSRETDMSIHIAEDGMLVKANNVYLIPPRKNMMIEKGKLVLVDHQPGKGLNFPIDIFFRSIAEDQHYRSIGVILSGTGSDGSRGIHAIKEAGGLVVVQDPKDAKFDGMPYSAVNTGCSDLVSNVNKIPKQIIKYMTHPLFNVSSGPLARHAEENGSILQEIFRLLEVPSKIDFSTYKTGTVIRRIERRIGVNQLRNMQDYLKFLLKNPEEVELLSKDMLIGVTRFFRDPEFFDELEKRVIPEMMQLGSRNEPVRVWVAGCSTGEEAYTVGILLAEALERLNLEREAKIFATDVDPEAIAKASLGQFNLNISEDLSPARLKKYFTQEEDHYVISSRIRQMIVFATHNLINDPPFSNTHLVICRNVLIYFQSECQKVVLSMLHFSLLNGGYLFLGSSESLGELNTCFDPMHERSRLFKKTGGGMPHFCQQQPDIEMSGTKPAIEGLNLLTGNQKRQQGQMSALVIDTLMGQYVPPCILVNVQFEILHIFGDVSSYTCKPKTGAFTSEITKAVATELSVPVATALSRAKATEQSVKYDEINITQPDNSMLALDLRVIQIKSNTFPKECYLVIFEARRDSSDLKTYAPSSEEGVPYKVTDQYQQRIQDLEIQLKNKQERLQITNEQLETANEELQSSNEELLAANEELQSTNEELQSVNEELYTVNSEYHDKIEELTRANSDIDNLMKSTDLGIVFLDDAVLIRKFTPAATSVFNLMNTDVHRPFYHINHNLLYDNLLDDLSTCIEKRVTFEKEVKTKDGRNILIKILPYIDDKSLPQGVVLLINDTSALRQLENKLAAQYASLQEGLRKGRLAHANSVAVLLLGIQEEVQKKISAIFSVLGDSYNVICAANIETAKIEVAQEAVDSVPIDLCLLDTESNSINVNDVIPLFQQTESSNRYPALLLLTDESNIPLDAYPKEFDVVDSLSKSAMTSELLEKSIEVVLLKKRVKVLLT